MKRLTRQVIVGAAQKLFSTMGYDGASMDAIATEANVTKVTIYRHFKNKEDLFAAALQGIVDELPASASVVSKANGPLPVRLTAVARNVLALATGTVMLRLHGLLTILASSAAASAEELWEAKLEPYHAGVQKLLAEEREAGNLKIEDPRVAARQFLSLVAGEPMVRLFLTGVAFRNAADADDHVVAAVDVFLRAYDSGRAA